MALVCATIVDTLHHFPLPVPGIFNAEQGNAGTVLTYVGTIHQADINLPTGITQNVADLLQSYTARTMLSNSEFIIMLNQAASDREELLRQQEYFYKRYLDNYTEDKYIDRHVRLYDEYT